MNQIGLWKSSINMRIRSSLFLYILASAAYAQSGSAIANLDPAHTRFVAVGDSLTAGVQNFSLLDFAAASMVTRKSSPNRLAGPWCFR